jgi:hypothetical protein
MLKESIPFWSDDYIPEPENKELEAILEKEDID